MSESNFTVPSSDLQQRLGNPTLHYKSPFDEFNESPGLSPSGQKVAKE